MGYDFLCESILGEVQKIFYTFRCVKSIGTVVRKICFKEGKWLVRKLVKTITFKTFVCWSQQLLMRSLRKTTVSLCWMILSEFVRF